MSAYPYFFSKGSGTGWDFVTIKYGQPIGIQQIGTEIPANYKLEQNYPNPFNPATKFNFEIPKSGNVEINIFDVLGSLVETIYKGYKPAGKYTIDFDGSKLASGVYFYRIEAGEFIKSRKMVLVK